MEILSIVGGFVGVILTLIFNARLARRQQERQWNEEREALRMGLIIELQNLAATLEAAVKTFGEGIEARKKGEHPEVLWPLSKNPVYLASIPRLGWLTQREALAVFEAYENFLTQERKTSWLSERVDERTYRIPAAHFSLCRDTLSGALPAINDALEELGRIKTKRP